MYRNGKPLYLKGVNWVPLDLLPGDELEEERYRYLLRAAVDAGVNAIRVWGGGGRERKLFYDLCDELGLLVWQEIPIACVFLYHLPEDDEYLALVRCETRGIVQQLRGHPSLALWGGGNEWGPGSHTNGWCRPWERSYQVRTPAVAGACLTRSRRQPQLESLAPSGVARSLRR